MAWGWGEGCGSGMGWSEAWGVRMGHGGHRLQGQGSVESSRPGDTVTVTFDHDLGGKGSVLCLLARARQASVLAHSLDRG